jgi:cyclophilin family peptidyl-prolyl cis-trans isomerase
MAKSKKIKPTRKNISNPQNNLRGVIVIISGAIILIVAVVSLSLPKLQNLGPLPTLAPPTKGTVQPTSTPAATDTITPTIFPPKESPTLTQYGIPPINIDVKKQYFGTFKLAKGGEFVVQFYPDKAPIAVNSFIYLAKKGYFNGTTFHRVLEGFMAQGGDPTGTGMGGPGYNFKNEDSDLTFDKPGVVAMANAGRDTNGSQFFITFAPAEYLNGGYTIFGQVIKGMDVVNGITRRDPDQSPTFTGDVIEKITIEEK